MTQAASQSSHAIENIFDYSAVAAWFQESGAETGLVRLQAITAQSCHNHSVTGLRKAEVFCADDEVAGIRVPAKEGPISVPLAEPTQSDGSRLCLLPNEDPREPLRRFPRC
jgi:hypothetical protein